MKLLIHMCYVLWKVVLLKNQVRDDFSSSSRTTEDFSTWQRIIRLDALRTSPEWVLHSLKQAEVSEEEASQVREQWVWSDAGGFLFGSDLIKKFGGVFLF